jgi:glycosyltransferase involved in cell wall biosynthesis
MISVIVPVYNVEKYLDKCIQSILKQTYKDFELILVDDGSLDNSPQMCDEYAHRFMFFMHFF